MIRQKTVFVVGAGASTNFGLPSGSDLKADVANLMNYELPDPWNLTGPFQRIFNQLKRAQQNSEIDLANINDALRAAVEIRAAMPLAQSIDNYLDAHRHDATANIVGKMAICQAIVEREGRSNLTSPSDSNIYNQFDFARSTNTWINALLRKLTEGVPRADVKTIFDNVAIVTFNYDRCIEQYMYYAIQRYYNLNEQEAVQVLGGLTIVHVYGQVGSLAWQHGAKATIPYGNVANASLLVAAKSISTFTEAATNESAESELQVAFAGCERVIFLGFSFQEQNVKILPRGSRYFAIYGTAQGMSRTNLTVIEEKLRTHFWGAAGTGMSNLNLEQLGAETFIDNYWRVIE